MVIDPQTGDSYRVVDVHQHLSPGEGSEGGLPLAERLEVLDRFGIDQAVLLPPSGAFGGEVVTAADLNTLTAAAVSAHPDRFAAGIATVDLTEGEAACHRTLTHAVSELGLRAVSWHHRFQGVYLDHAYMPGLVHRCAELGVPAFIHVIAESTLEAPWRLGKVLEQCPEATVVALDGFSSSDQAGEMIELAQRYDNLYCDLGGMISVSGWTMKAFLDAVGPSRLLFGTNLYMVPRTWYAPGPLFEVLHLDVPPAWKTQILADNAESLLGLG